MLQRRKKRIKPSSFTFFPTETGDDSADGSPFFVIKNGRIRKVSNFFGLNAWRKGDNLAIEVYAKLGSVSPYWREEKDGVSYWEKAPNSLIPQEISLTAYDLGNASGGKKTIQFDLDEEFLHFRLDLCGRSNIFRKRRGQKSSQISSSVVDEAMLRVYKPSWLLWPTSAEVSQSHGDTKTLSTTRVNFNPTRFRDSSFKGGRLLSFLDINDKSRWHSGVFYHFWLPLEVVEGIEAMF